MSKHDKYINKLLDNAQHNLEKHASQLEKQLTQTLQRKYKGKKVKCECFDSDKYGDDDDYYFNDILLDIQAFQSYEKDGFYVDVTFNYKGICAKEEDKPEPHTFHLKSIEGVK